MLKTWLVTLWISMMLTILPLPEAAQPVQLEQPVYDRLDAHLEAKLQEVRIPGLAIGVVQGEEVVYLRGYGTGGSAGAVTPQTPFILGSVSKGVTALAVMQLVEAGKLALDAPVQDYLAWFEPQDITVRHLLNQTSGFTARTGRSMMADDYDGTDAIQKYARQMSAEQRTRRAGEQYEYTNANYVILGALIEVVSGQSYQEYMHEHIFAPLKMTHSFASKRMAAGQAVSTGHNQWFGFPVPFDMPYPYGDVPAGYLITSAEDMSHYLVAQMNSGVYQGKQILSAEGIETLHRGAAITSGNEFYAMGWEVGEREGLQAIFHSGDVPNFQSYIILLPEHDLGLVMLMNAHSTLNGMQISHLAWDAAHILVGQDPVVVKTDPMIGAIVGVIAAIVLTTILLLVWAIRIVRRGSPGKKSGIIAVPVTLLLAIAAFNLVGLPNLFGIPIRGMLLFSPDLSWPAVLAGASAALGAVLFPIWILLRFRPVTSSPGTSNLEDNNTRRM